MQPRPGVMRHAPTNRARAEWSASNSTPLTGADKPATGNGRIRDVLSLALVLAVFGGMGLGLLHITATAQSQIEAAQ